MTNKTTTSRYEELRDDDGRSYRAPAWSGDITTLSIDELHERIEALGAHIGRLSTEWNAFDGYRARADFATVAAPWVAKRIACLTAYDRRRGERAASTRAFHARTSAG